MSVTFSMLILLGRDILSYIFLAVLKFPFVKWMVAAVRRDFFALRMPHIYDIQCRRYISKEMYLIRSIESVKGMAMARSFYL
jgi:hypothetical protein